MSSRDCDVVIIGAGAAGLAAARELAGSGKKVIVLEARERIGGRIHTLHYSDLPVPVELGAEFVHGEVDATFSIIDAAGLTALELADNHWWSRNGRWQLVADYWKRLDKVRAQIGALTSDVSFEEFLRSRRGITAQQRELARTFVENYHAAHAERMSARALRSADSEQSQDDPGANKQFRLLNGYDAVVNWLRGGIDPAHVQIRLSTVAREVRWAANDVAVVCGRGGSEETLRARALIVTVPLGVLKAPRDQEGAIRFDPPLRETQKALAKLEAGHVVKLVLRFRERFWGAPGFMNERTRGRSAAALTFLHASDRFIPTWWTAAPVRAPIVTGWAGGHAADALLAEGAASMTDRALDSMSAAFAVSRRVLDAQHVATYTHDWQSDPFSRCAYSYAGVGGEGAHDALARPLRRTIFFAGEATHSEQTGTVAGAIESGQRAARALL